MTTELQQVITQKREAWAQMGEAVHLQEMQLQAEAGEALISFELPIGIETVPAAEVLLTGIKQRQASIQEKRKAITGKFDAVTQRLMLPEKSLTAPITELSNAIIAVKKQWEKDQKVLKDIADEKKKAVEFFAGKMIEIDTALKSKVNDLISRCYEKAFTQDVTMEGLDDYITSSIDAVTINSFTYPSPVFHAQYLTPVEVDEIRTRAFIIDKAIYPALFAAGIKEKFSDYETALANKSQALALSQQQDKEAADELAMKANNSQMALKMQAASTPVDTTPVYTKALKKSYEIDMPETAESMVSIMAAFSANIHLCLPKLKVEKWFSFTAKQAAGALAKVKCDDNNFSSGLLIFKEVDKL